MLSDTVGAASLGGVVAFTGTECTAFMARTRKSGRGAAMAVRDKNRLRDMGDQETRCFWREGMAKH